jgi:hypothetical protein
MATWVGIFVSNLDGKSVRQLEVKADDEETAIMLLDLYDYDETWQQYSFVEVQKKERFAIALGNGSLQKELQDLKKTLCMPLANFANVDIRPILTTLVCVHCFSLFGLCKVQYYYGQLREFNRSEYQVCSKDRTDSQTIENTQKQQLGKVGDR